MSSEDANTGDPTTRENVQKAVIDRIVDGQHAVLLVGDDETEVVVPVEELPEGAAEGSWLRLKVSAQLLQGAVVDDEETERRRQRIAGKLDQLRQRGRRDGR